MDEATAGLDREYCPRLIQWLQQFLAGGGRMVWCTHLEEELKALCGSSLRLESPTP